MASASACTCARVAMTYSCRVPGVGGLNCTGFVGMRVAPVSSNGLVAASDMMPFSRSYTCFRMLAPRPSLVTSMPSYHACMSAGRIAVMRFAPRTGLRWSRRYCRYFSLVPSRRGSPLRLRCVST